MGTAGRLLARDDWQGTNGTAWTATGAPWSQIASSANTVVDVQSSQGRIETTASPIGAYLDYGLALLRPPGPDFDLVVDLTISAATGYSNIAWRLAGTTWWAPWPVAPTDGLIFELARPEQVWACYRMDADASTSLGSVAYTFSTSVAQRVRVRADGPFMGIKVWLASSGEPTSWGMVLEDRVHRKPDRSFVQIAALGDSSVGANSRFDNLELRALDQGRRRRGGVR